MLKEVEQGGLVAWNFQKQNQHCFATASITPNEQNECLLQIFQFDILDKQKRPKEIGSLNIGKPTRSLTWSTFGTENGYNYGLILLGLEDSSILIIDAEAILYQSQQQRQPVIHQEFEIFENLGPIEALAYNSLKPNLIAIGGEEVLIMDISFQNNVIDPILFSPDAEHNPHNNSIVTAVSWNQKLNHILASASQNGITVIWDLKSNKPIKSFGGDSFRTINEDVCLAWSPVNPTCVAKTEEQSKSQEVQIWDLRDPKGPVMILEKCEKGGHQGHISTISWCTTDTSLVLTGGFDQRVICWNIKDQQPISVEEFDEQIKDIKWSQINNLYSVTLLSGKVILKSLDNDETSIAPPKWYVPPVGANISITGDISTFHESSQQLKIHSKESQSENFSFLDFDEFFEQQSQLESTEKLCNWVLQEGKYHQKDQLVWKLLKAVSNNSNFEILETLGFSRSEIQKKAEVYTGKTHKVAQEDKNDENTSASNRKKKVEHTVGIADIDEQGAMDFFGQLAQESLKPKEQSRDRSASNLQRLSSSNIVAGGDEILVEETISRNVNWDTGVEKIIKENLIISNYDGAIDSAMKCGRYAEALLIAYSQGPNVLENTMKDYFTSNTDPFIKNVLRNVVKKNNAEMVQVYNLDHWKECIGLLLNSVQDKNELKLLINNLGERFLSELKDEDSAILCFIISTNFGKLAEIYYERIQNLRFNSLERKQELVRYLEIMIVLNQLLQDQQESNLFFNQMILEVSRYLYDDNMIVAAYSVLLEADGNYQRIANFKDQLYNSFATKLSPYYDPPQQPFKIRNIQIIQKQQPINHNINNRPQIGGRTNQPRDNFNPNNNINNRQPPISGPNINNNPNNNRPQPPIKGPTRPNNPFGGPSNTFNPNNPINNNNNNIPQPPTNQPHINQPPVNNPNNNARNIAPPINNPMNNTFNNNNQPQQPHSKPAPPPVAKKEHKTNTGPKHTPPNFQPKAVHTNNPGGGFAPPPPMAQQQQQQPHHHHQQPQQQQQQFNQPPPPPAHNNNNPNLNQNSNVAPPPPVNRGPPAPPKNNFAPPPPSNATSGHNQMGMPPAKPKGAAGIPPPPIRR